MMLNYYIVLFILIFSLNKICPFVYKEYQEFVVLVPLLYYQHHSIRFVAPAYHTKSLRYVGLVIALLVLLSNCTPVVVAFLSEP